jgi:DNA-directed RNA polymerase I subunit RPA1
LEPNEEDEEEEVKKEKEGEEEAEQIEEEQIFTEEKQKKKKPMLGSSPYLEDYSIKRKKSRFEMVLKVPVTGRKIMMIPLLQSVAEKFVIKAVKSINKCYVVDDDKGKRPWTVQTEGVNFQDIWAMRDMIDVNNIQCNDIYAVLQTFGVEAARRTIVQEITKVFEPYGISVDYRHLSLIADYMVSSFVFLFFCCILFVC